MKWMYFFVMAALGSVLVWSMETTVGKIGMFLIVAIVAIAATRRKDERPLKIAYEEPEKTTRH